MLSGIKIQNCLLGGESGSVVGNLTRANRDVEREGSSEVQIWKLIEENNF